MERIGVVLARLGLDPVSLAARGHSDSANEFSGPTSGVNVGPMQSGMDGMGMVSDGPADEGSASPSMPGAGVNLAVSAQAPGKGKENGPIPGNGEGIGPSEGQRGVGGRMRLSYEARVRLVLPVGRGMRSVNRQPGLPTPALRRPMLIVVEGGHAAPRSITL